MEEIFIFLENIKDERQEWKVVHKLSDIVFIVLTALLANADDWQEIELFAKTNVGLLGRYVPLKNGIPSHDTMQRVMACIRPETLQRLNQLWNELLDEGDREKLKKILCIDGKTMRGNGNKNKEVWHVVSAWSKENGVCFGQKSANSKGKEIPMIEDLLNTISVKNQIVTIDAIGTQSKITEKAHGQIGIREYFQTSDIKWLPDKEKWIGLKSIGMAKTVCKSKKGESIEVRYFISSLKPDAELFSRAVRGHWAVESMHWHLDVTFREDHNQTLEKNAAENMNILRKWALSILKSLELDKKYSLKKKRFAIGRNFSKFVDRLMNL